MVPHCEGCTELQQDTDKLNTKHFKPQRNAGIVAQVTSIDESLDLVSVNMEPSSLPLSLQNKSAILLPCR